MDTFKKAVKEKEKKEKRERKKFMSKKIITPTFVNCYEVNNIPEQKFSFCHKLKPINYVKRKSIFI